METLEQFQSELQKQPYFVVIITMLN